MEPETEDVFLVDVRKYGLDESSPRWRRVFFENIYLPFLRFCFKWLKIPAQGTIHPDGSFSWVENIGVATEMETACAMCKGEFYRVSRLPLNDELPLESVQYKGHIYPKLAHPNRYNQRVFPLTVVKRADVDLIQKVNAKLDKLLNTARAG